MIENVFLLALDVNSTGRWQSHHATRTKFWSNIHLLHTTVDNKSTFALVASQLYKMFVDETINQNDGVLTLKVSDHDTNAHVLTNGAIIELFEPRTVSRTTCMQQ